MLISRFIIGVVHIIIILTICFWSACAPLPPTKLLQEGKYLEAITFCEEQLNKHPGNEKLRQFLYSAYRDYLLQEYDKGNLEEVLNICERGKLRFRDEPIFYFYAHLAKGQKLLQERSKDKLWQAINEFTNARLIMPDSYLPYFWMGMAYARLDRNDFDPIINNLQTALEKAGDYEIKKKIDQELQKHLQRKKKLYDFWGGNPYKDR